MIGLDAAEPSLIEQWTADGSLPHLRRLMDGGAYGRLASTADWLSGSPWPTFYTGTTPADHGYYSYLSWRSDRMRVARPTPDTLPLARFWQGLSAFGPRAVAIDVPSVYTPEPFHGLEITSWGTHDALVPASSTPSSLLQWLHETFGPSPRSAEVGIPLPLDRLLETRDEEIRVTDQLGRIAVALMERESWDLFLISFTSPHRAGHKLWDESGTTDSGPEARDPLRAALRDVYVAVDEAVGEVIGAAGDQATVLVFSLHGMGTNTSRNDVLGSMLERVLKNGQGNGGVGRRSDRFRSLVPAPWRHAVKRRLPMPVQDRLTVYWRMRGFDWARTPAFTLPADLQGYIRVNLRGREAQGIVERGTQYDDLCEEIASGLGTFVDADTGEPIVRRVTRIDEVFPGGQSRDLLPDLVVQWSPTAAARHHRIISDRYGSVPWPNPGRNLSGRSGNHTSGGQGFLVAVGDRFPAGGRFLDADILDLAPTAFDLFGLPAPRAMRGRSVARKLSLDPRHDDAGRDGGKT